jgi:hypothetical protein
MESRPVEITEEENDQGMDLQGLRWGIGDIPVKEDFREKRYASHYSPLIAESKIMDL